MNSTLLSEPRYEVIKEDLSAVCEWGFFVISGGNHCVNDTEWAIVDNEMIDLFNQHSMHIAHVCDEHVESVKKVYGIE